MCALARSERAAAIVRALGADPVPGDLSDLRALQNGAEGADVEFREFVTPWITREARLAALR
jgi:hypothetical protein